MRCLVVVVAACGSPRAPVPKVVPAALPIPATVVAPPPPPCAPGPRPPLHYAIGDGPRTRTPHGEHRMVAMSDGRLVIGGGPDWFASLEMLDTARSQWTPLGWPTDDPKVRGNLRPGAFAAIGESILLARIDAGSAAAPRAAMWRDGAWTDVAGVAIATDGATATTLRDGRVLIVGGTHQEPGSEHLVREAQLWDAAHGIAQTAPPLQARRQHAAVVLADGRVMIAGGSDAVRGGAVLASVELFDPATATWSAGAPMYHPRLDPTLTLLPDGHVLVAGGGDLALEDRDPATGSWTEVGALPELRAGASATALPDCRVVFIGGGGFENDAFVSAIAAAVWDAANRRWDEPIMQPHARWNHAAWRGPDGQLFVVGGYEQNERVSRTEIWTPVATAPTPTIAWHVPPWGLHAGLIAPLPDGDLVLANAGRLVHGETATDIAKPPEALIAVAAIPGGVLGVARDRLTLHRWDGHAWTAAGRIPQRVRKPHEREQTWPPTLTPFADGRVFIVGFEGGAMWKDGVATASPISPRHEHSATLLADGRLLIAGGLAPAKHEERPTMRKPPMPYLRDAFVVDPARNLVTPVAPLPPNAPPMSASVLLADGRVLLAGFRTQESADAWIYDPSADTWTPTGQLVHALGDARLVRLDDGRVLAIGGERDLFHPDPSPATIELYDPAHRTWTLVGALPDRFDNAIAFRRGAAIIVATAGHAVELTLREPL